MVNEVIIKERLKKSTHPEAFLLRRTIRLHLLENAYEKECVHAGKIFLRDLLFLLRVQQGKTVFRLWLELLD